MRIPFKILIILLLVVSSIGAKATHIIGGELYYSKLDSSNYEITLKVYRDCYNGVPWFDVPARIKIFDSSNNFLQVHYMYDYTWSVLDPYLDTLCVVVPPDVCVEEAIYRDTVSLPPIPGGYQMSYTRCCRNATILNINGPDTVGITILSTIPDTAIVDTNSSPRFNNFPPIMICAGQPLEFDHSASDPDGDSIVYELCTPYHGGNIPNVYGVNPVEAPPYDPVPWTAPYYDQDPLGGIPLSIDSVGFLTGTPSTVGQFVVGVCAYEYRDSVLLSVNRRDFQFNVLPCLPVPTAAIPANMLVCADSNNAVTFDIESIENAISFSWDFGDPGTIADTSHLQAPSYVYPDTGYYDITLIVNEGYTCEDTGYAQVYVQPGVEAPFTFQNSCFPEPVDFQGAPFTHGGTLTNVEWIFEPGAYGYSPNEQYSYAQHGVYPVSLIAVNSYGCADTVTQYVNVYEKPQADFISDTVCIGETTSFQSTSQASASVVQFTSWDFDDGNMGFGTTVTNQYQNAGVYDVMLVIQNNFGCLDTMNQNVLVADIPTANFIATTGCVGDPVNFMDISSSQTPVSGWTWWIDTIQEGSFDQHPTFYFAAPGTYDIQLIVENQGGCVDTIVQAVDVFYDPVADFNYNNVCFGDTNQFFDQSTIQGSSIVSYQWFFGSNGFSPAQNPYFTFSQPGEHQVSLVVTSQDGCIDTVYQTVTAYYLPVADFEAETVCLNDTVWFSDLSTVQGDSITSWSWNFDNGDFSSSATPYTFYNNNGSYDVGLVVESSNGCADEFIQSIQVYDLPIAIFSFENVCEGSTVDLEDQSVSIDPIMNWIWDINGEDSTSQNVLDLTLGSYGSYPVQLIIETSNGCFDTANATVQIHPVPSADFIAESDCESDLAAFTDNSTLAQDQINSWLWDFGDGNSAVDQNTTNTFPGVGEYDVTLVVESENGCIDTTQQTIYNLEPASASFSVAEDKGCAPLSTAVFAVSNGDFEYWWEFTDGTVSDSSAVPLLFEDPGVYGFNLVVTNLEGCSDSISIANMFTVYGNPVSDFDWSPEEASVYEPFFQFENQSSSDAEYFNWSFGDGGSSNETNPLYEYPDTGSYPVQLIVENQYGCIDSVTYLVRVNGNFFVYYVPNTFTPNENNVNDVFNGTGIGVELFQMKIYNRWGENIFTTDDPDKGWSGTRNGVPSPIGTYVYVIEIRDVLGDDHRYLGHVNLVR